MSACAPAIQYHLPTLNEADQQRLVCPAPASVAELVEGLPGHVALAASDGTVVRTPDGQTWVSFASANAREGELLARMNTASGAHFECFDDLEWVADLWNNPDLTGD